MTSKASGAQRKAGGARLLLWRDTLSMVPRSPLTGFGRENFIAEFPRYQSVGLAHAYPDFYHESPHNLILDAVAGEGLLGCLALVVFLGLGLRSGYRSARLGSAVAEARTISRDFNRSASCAASTRKA